jgi:hypothetical protein
MGTGFLGTRSLLPALSASGQHDLAVRLLQSRKFPSWGYEIDQGATTIWERWNSYTKDHGFGGSQNAAMNSFAHYSFGAVCEWMFSQLAGIDTDGPGYKRILIRPGPPSPTSNPDQPPIDWVRAHYDSIQGRIAVYWKRLPESFELEVTIPANTSATVFLPASDAEAISEAGAELAKVKRVKLLRMEAGQIDPLGKQQMPAKYPGDRRDRSHEQKDDRRGARCEFLDVPGDGAGHEIEREHDRLVNPPPRDGVRLHRPGRYVGGRRDERSQDLAGRSEARVDRSRERAIDDVADRAVEIGS